MMKIVATTSLSAIDRPNTDRWNAARSCQNLSQGSLLHVWKYVQLSISYLSMHNFF